jgi:hypothetical protein
MENITEVLKSDGEAEFGKAIIKSFEDLGLGILSKSDFEALMFHQLTLIVDPDKVKDNYDWMKLLKVTPSKLRSLQMTRSAKFLNLNLDNEDNWKLIFNAINNKKLETEDKENGKVRIYIDDLHVHRLIERFVVEGGSSVDYTLNKNQLVLKYTEFLNLFDNILQRAKGTPLLAALNEDRSELKVESEFNKLDSVLKDVKVALKDKAYDKVAEFALSTIIKIAKKKLGI